MIRYSLACAHDHEFEGWFDSSDGFEAQVAKHLVECPACGSTAVRRAPMAPAVVTAERRSATAARMAAAMGEMAAKVRAHVEETHDYVGRDFPDEARAIHTGKAEDRPIWGEASHDEAKALADEGIAVAPLPAAPASSEPKKLN
jgi:hypothetical protein